MLTNLHAIFTTRTVNKELIVDIDCYMMNVHPAFAFSRTTSVYVTTIIRTFTWVKAGEED